MFLKLASIPGLFISAALGFYGLGHVSGQSKAIAGLSTSQPLAASADVTRETVSSETLDGSTAQPNSRRAWVDPSRLEKFEQVTRTTRREVDEQAACRAKLIWANKFHVLYALEGQSWDRLDLIVGPPFELLSLQEKEDFIHAIHCIAKTGRGGPLRIRILHWKSREMIGELVAGKLTMI